MPSDITGMSPFAVRETPRSPLSPRPPLQNRTYSAPAGDLFNQQDGRIQDVASYLEHEPMVSTDLAPAQVSDEVPRSRSRLPQVNLAVIGAQSVGKSTFVKCALDLKQIPLVRSSLKKMSLDGTIYVVRLLEIALHKITLDQGRIVWPRFLGEQELPPIDGVLALFDSSDLRSVAEFPHIFDVVREEQSPSARNRSATSSNVFPRQAAPQNRQHTRATSENPRPATGDTTLLDRPDGVVNDSTGNSNLAHNAHASKYARSSFQPFPPRTPPPDNRTNRPTNLTVETVPENSSSTSRAPHQRLRASWRNSAASDAFSSFLDMEDDPDDPKATSHLVASKGSKDKLDYPGETLDELVGRLLSLPLSKQEAKFSPVFLCLYRKFATPAQLLTSIIAHFEKISASDLPHLTRNVDQLRFLNVLAQWVSDYPGDFAAAKTRNRLNDFLTRLESEMAFLVAAKEINTSLEKYVDDDDLCWAFNNGELGADSLETFLDTSVQSSPSTFVASNPADMINSMSTLDLTEEHNDMSSQYSNFSTSSVDRSGSISSQSFRTLMSIESAQREAQRLELIPRNLLTKMQWRIFMDTPDEEFAREVTRMDWIMYSSFRPRELIRHVSVATGEKDKPSSNLENINRMIKSFNHLAFFVASMILLRDKAKNRAETLEKFMNISLKLRQLNNYNSLGAVTAGLNGTPVARLAQTRELVSHNVQKQFMSLVILMGTQRSHFAYRLAWENSFNERIPFLPLHLRDLVSAEEGNKSFIGEKCDRINWRKFEIMGEVILSIQQSQKTPFPSYPRHDIAQRLILETKFGGDEEDLYSRSMRVESTAGGAADAGRKRFAWRRN